MRTSIRYQSYPRTEPPPDYIDDVVAAFIAHEQAIGTRHLEKGLTSDAVLIEIAEDLKSMGFQVEEGKRSIQKIHRPVFFGENGEPTLKYEVDAYHPEWHCGLEIEAGRAWMGNAIYRDLVQAMVMVQVETLILAVSNAYKYRSGGRSVVSLDYEQALKVADTLYGHSRFRLPYSLVAIGY